MTSNGEAGGEAVEMKQPKKQISFYDKEISKPQQQDGKTPKQEEKLDRSLVHFEIEGISKITASKTFSGKLFWLMLLLTALSIATYEVAKTVTDYYNSPIVTSYKIVAQESMVFPQIYICPSNKVRKSYLAHNMSHFNRTRDMASTLVYKIKKENTTKTDRPKRSLFEEDGIEPEEFYRFKRDLTNRTFDMSSHSHINRTNFPPLADNNTYEYFRQIYMDMGVLQEDFFVACQFREYLLKLVNCTDILTPVVDPDYGRCYVVNVGQRNQSVPAQGLSIIFNMKTHDYPIQPELQPKYDGILVSIAKRFDPTNFEKVLIPPNTYTKVDISAQHLKFLNVKSGPAKLLCNKDEFKFEILNVSYSESACQRECFFRTVLNRCKCLVFTDPLFMNKNRLKTNRTCTLHDITECLQPDVTDSAEAQEEVAQCASNCTIPCESWRFNTRVSYMPMLDVPFGGFPNDTTMYDISMVQFAFPYLEYDEFTQDWSMSINDMIGNIGGQIGLWLGASMLTLLQIPITLFTLSGYHAYTKATPQLKKVTRRLTQSH